MATLSELRNLFRFSSNYYEFIPTSTFQTAVGINLLSTLVGDTGWLDLWAVPGAAGQHFEGFTLTVQANSAVTAGQVVIEGTHTLAGVSVALERTTGPTDIAYSTAAFGLSSNQNATFSVANPLGLRYVRVRISTTWTGATTGVRVTSLTLKRPTLFPQLFKAAVQGTVTASVTGSVNSTGTAVHSAAASGNPVQVGGVVRVAQDTTLVANDMARVGMSSHGNVITTPNNHPESYFSFVGQISAEGAIGAAAGAGLRYYITQITLSNNGAANGIPTIGNAGGTVVWQCVMNTNGSVLTMPIIASFPTPLRCGSNLALNINPGGVTLLNYSVSGFIAP